MIVISISSVVSILCIVSYLSLESELETLRRQTSILESRVMKMSPAVLLPMQERLTYSRSHNQEDISGDTHGQVHPQELNDKMYRNVDNNNKHIGDQSFEDPIINDMEVSQQEKLHGILSSNEDAGDQSLDKNTNKNPSLIKTSQTSMIADPLTDSAVIFYNRVPKTGSTSFVGIVYEVCRDLGYHVIHVNTSRNSHVLSLLDQERFVSNISHWKDRRPALFHGHISFIDFSKFGSSAVKPIYINMLRDPIERLVSYYYFLRFGDDFSLKTRRRKGNRVSFDDCLLRKEHDCDPVNMWLQIPFFCGHSFKCWVPGSEWALQQAKYNLVNHYLVVGVTEEMHDFFALLEVVLPKFFSGSTRLYEEGNKSHLRKTFNKQPVTQETLDQLRQSKIWMMEQDFYEFAKAQFHFLKKLTFGGNSKEAEGASGDDSDLTRHVDIHRLHSQRFFYDKLKPKFI